MSGIYIAWAAITFICALYVSILNAGKPAGFQVGMFTIFAIQLALFIIPAILL